MEKSAIAETQGFAANGEPAGVIMTVSFWLRRQRCAFA